MKLQHFFDNSTFTLTYVVYDEATKDAVIIDPVLDYNPVGASISLNSFSQLTSWLDAEKITPRMILETHAHADHLSSSQYLKQRYPGLILAISDQITIVQECFREVFDLPELRTDGSQFDLLLTGGKDYEAGSLKFEVMHTPGHTPACSCFIFGSWVFSGDVIFMPDYGTGRCDFPGGSAVQAYDSIMNKLYRLPDKYQVYVGHDYMPDGRPLAFMASVGKQKTTNRHIKADTTEAEFVAFRRERDQQLSPPRLLYESVQFNIAAGHLPPAHPNGRRYLRLPLAFEQELGG